MSYQSKVAEILAAAAAEAGGATTAEEFLSWLEAPKNRELGDVALPCFRLAKALQKAPPVIAQDLAQRIMAKVQPGDLVASVVATGPYLNFRIDPSARARMVLEGARLPGFGRSEVGAGRTVGIDYSSPNIAKPFGIGHLRSTAIGNALKNIFSSLGYRVVGINHLGDWGTQFGKLMSAFERWGDRAALTEAPIAHLYELYVRFHKEAEGNAALEDEGRAWFRRLELGDPAAEAYWKEFRALSLQEFQRIYDRLGVSFDHDWGEAFYNDMLEQLVADAVACGITEVSQGALIVPLEDLGLAPCLLRKTDGATLYATRDLAAARYRYEKLHFDQFLYVVGLPQAEHFRQVFEVLRRMGYDWADRCKHVGFGHIHGISSRKGTLVFLEEILDRGKDLVRQHLEASEKFDPETRERVAEQIAIGSIIFYDLSRSRTKDYDFSWDQMLKGLVPGERGQTGVYVQYTQARLASVLDKYRETWGELAETNDLDFSHVADDSAMALIQILERWPAVLVSAAAEYEPSEVTRYLLDLANEFNSWYSGGNKVVSELRPQSQARAVLASAVRQVMKMGMEILGVPAPERI